MIWKLYPYEWLVQEKLGSVVTSPDFFDDSNIRWLEPPWKLVLSSKAMLAYLWEKHRDHPNLLPTYWDVDVLEHMKFPTTEKTQWVAKPWFGREGVGIMYSDDYESWQDFVKAVKNASPSKKISSYYNNHTAGGGLFGGGVVQSSISNSNTITAAKKGLTTDWTHYFRSSSIHKTPVVTSPLRERDWGTEHSKEESPIDGYFVGHPIFQLYHPPAILQGRTVVTSAWIINGLPVGICFREDLAKTTNDDSCFVPHVTTREGSTHPNALMSLEYPLSPRAKRLREEFYGKNAIPVDNNNNEGKKEASTKQTYEDYRTTHSQGPVGYYSTSSGIGWYRNSSGGGGGWFRGFRGFWNRKPTDTNNTAKNNNNKSSGYAGTQSSKSSQQQHGETMNKKGGGGGGGRNKGQRFRTGATGRGVSRGGAC